LFDHSVSVRWAGVRIKSGVAAVIAGIGQTTAESRKSIHQSVPGVFRNSITESRSERSARLAAKFDTTDTEFAIGEAWVGGVPLPLARTGRGQGWLTREINSSDSRE
jgi:hypothetical protein